jgi:hypothetical protein
MKNTIPRKEVIMGKEIEQYCDECIIQRNCILYQSNNNLLGCSLFYKKNSLNYIFGDINKQLSEINL